MDKNNLHNILPGYEYVPLKTAVDKTFNGWFLMNTPQVSTGGVFFRCRNNSSKKQPGCNKIAVQFFSLHTGYPLWELVLDHIPSKYMFMKITLMNTRNGKPSFIIRSQTEFYENTIAGMNYR
jgi:hypothetical protein